MAFASRNDYVVLTQGQTFESANDAFLRFT